MDHNLKIIFATIALTFALFVATACEALWTALWYNLVLLSINLNNISTELKS